MLVLACGQLRTLGEHCQAAAAQRAPTSGSPPGEKQNGEGDAQMGVTEQTVQIKMEDEEDHSSPGSPGQGWGLGRAAGQGWGPVCPTRCLNFQGPRSPEEEVSARAETEVEEDGAGRSRDGGEAHRGRNQGRPSEPECKAV